MDCNKVGKLILTLRHEKGMTQKQLADKMNISDRTISKWERGVGCPDVSLLPELSAVFKVNIEKILLGDLEPNTMNSGNMKKVKFYVCPDCGSIACATGETEVFCCGRKLSRLQAQSEDLAHTVTVTEIETDLYVTLRHDMDKQHYITFVAYVVCDKVLLIKLYPEQQAEARFPKMSGGELYLCCNRHGLFRAANFGNPRKSSQKSFILEQ